MGVCRRQWMPFWPPLLLADKPTSIKHTGQYNYIDFYINFLNSTKPFDSSLEKWMRKAARHLDGVDSLNPCRWRGERIHLHGGGVCWLFVLLWMDSWCHKLIVCKKWYKNNLKMRLTALLFDPPRRAPISSHHCWWTIQSQCDSGCVGLKKTKICVAYLWLTQSFWTNVQMACLDLKWNHVFFQQRLLKYWGIRYAYFLGVLKPKKNHILVISVMSNIFKC